jgi:hypothetical protein
MRIIGCDLHASQRSIAMLDRETGETADVTLKHEGDTVRDSPSKRSTIVLSENGAVP